MAKILFFILICILIPHNIYFAEINKEEFINARDAFIKSDGDRIINDIVVKGNRKTKKSEIINKINVKAGKYLSEFDPEHSVQELRRLKLYSKIKIEYIPLEEKLVNITIIVDEKISLIPLPFMRFTGDSKTYGFMLMDLNFFGYQKNLWVGGFWETEGFNYLLGYMDPSVMGSNYFLNIITSTGNKEFENADREGDIYRIYRAKSSFSSLSLGYKLSDNWKFAILNRYYNLRVDNDYNESINPPQSGRFYKPGANVEFDNLYFSRLFNYGMKARIEYERGIVLNEGAGDFDHVNTFVEYNLEACKEDRFIFNISGGTGNDPAILFKQIAGSPGFRTLPYGKVFTNKYLAGSINYEIPLHKGRFLTSTAIGFYEGGGMRNDNTGEVDYFYGPGGGFRLYLKKIAFPAVGFNAAYNIITKNSEFSLSIGFSR